VDMLQENVVEPLRVKTQAIKSASETANMILRIDDVLAAAKSKMMGEESQYPGMPPARGGFGE